MQEIKPSSAEGAGEGDGTTFRRARTKEQIASRKEEIVNACAVLYEKGGFDGVTFKAISEMTSFTRQSIYKYYGTREEVLLDLLSRDEVSWQADMMQAMDSYDELSKEDLAMILTSQFSDHGVMLQLTSLLFNVIEMNSSTEKLAEFRANSIDVYHLLYMCLAKYFPEARQQDLDSITATLFALAVGLYPMNHLSQKQLEAERLANSFYVYPAKFNRATFFETSYYNSVLLLFSALDKK